MSDSNKQYWLKSGSYTLMLNIQQLLFGFGSFYLLVRMLDKQDFGIWTLFVATTSIFEMARSGLIQYALIKFLSESPEEEKPKIIAASFILSGFIMCICIAVNLSIAGYLSRLWHYPGLVGMFIIFNGVYILQGLLSQFQWIEQAHLKFHGILITTMMKQGGFFLFVFISFIFHSHINLDELIYVQVICTAIGMVAEYYFIRDYLRISWQLHMGWVKKLFGYGKFVFGTYLGTVLSGSINQMMLGTMISPAAAGSYNVAIRIVSLTDIPTNALGAIVFPQSAKRFAAQGIEAGKYLYEKSVGTIVAILIPMIIFVFCFPGFVVRIVAGMKYGEAAPMVQFVILTCLFSPFDRFFGVILDSIGRAKLNFVIIFTFIAISLVLNYFLIGRIGIMGCIYGTLIADGIIFIIRQVLLYKILNVNLLSPFIYAWRFYPEFLRQYVKPLLGKLPD
jgi:O-antigen/teichoic acid export membrane protein